MSLIRRELRQGLRVRRQSIAEIRPDPEEAQLPEGDGQYLDELLAENQQLREVARDAATLLTVIAPDMRPEAFAGVTLMIERLDRAVKRGEWHGVTTAQPPPRPAPGPVEPPVPPLRRPVSGC